MAAWEVYRGAPMEGPLQVQIVVFIKRPGRLGTGGMVPCDVKRGDVDNYAKSILDGLNASGVWVDDCQVCQLSVAKVYAASDGETGAIVEVSQWTDRTQQIVEKWASSALSATTSKWT